MTVVNEFKNLAEPWSLGEDLVLKNRVVMASLTRNRNLTPDAVNAKYYAQRASAGLIMSEGILIEPQGTQYMEAPGIWTKDQIAGWQGVTKAVHDKGGVIFAQLWHLGRAGHKYHNGGVPPPAPSAVAAQGGKFRLLVGCPGYSVPQAIEDPKEYVLKFKQAAINAKEAGFDGVELNSANGYLPHQFLDSNANQRTDDYGGSVVNRCRFTLEAIDALVSVYGSSRVGVKLTPSGGYNDVGEASEEATIELFNHLLTELNQRKIGFIQLTRHVGLLDPMQRGIPLDLSVLFPKITNVTVILNGGFTPTEAKQVIKAGSATAVAFGRPFIPNPDFVYRTFNNLSLSTVNDIFQLYEYAGGDKNVGYADFPNHPDNPEKFDYV